MLGISHVVFSYCITAVAQNGKIARKSPVTDLAHCVVHLGQSMVEIACQ